MRPLVLWIVLLGITITLLAQAQPDNLIVPGERIGPVTRTSTEESLLRELGKDAVVEDVDTGEALFERGLVLFKNDPSRRLDIVWSYRDPAHPGTVFLCPYLDRTVRCRWRTASGIGEGTSLEELERLNGEPFQMVKWGSDVGGNVRFERGRLHDELQPPGGGLWLTLNGDRPPLTRAEKNQVDGTTIFIPSGNAVLRKINPHVGRMRVTFDQDQVRKP